MSTPDLPWQIWFQKFRGGPWMLFAAFAHERHALDFAAERLVPRCFEVRRVS